MLRFANYILAQVFLSKKNILKSSALTNDF